MKDKHFHQNLCVGSNAVALVSGAVQKVLKSTDAPVDRNEEDAYKGSKDLEMLISAKIANKLKAVAK